MKEKDSIFSAEPDRLKRLVDMGLGEEEAEADAHEATPASVGGLLEGVGSQIGRYELLECIGGSLLGFCLFLDEFLQLVAGILEGLIRIGVGVLLLLFFFGELFGLFLFFGRFL